MCTRGSQRWISLGLFKLQPAELAKPVLVAMLGVLHRRQARVPRLPRDLPLRRLITAPLAFLVFIQPDFGTMLVLMWILLTMLVIGGADWRHLRRPGSRGIIGVVSLFQLGIMKDYQQTRFEAFLDPDEPTRTGRDTTTGSRARRSATAACSGRGSSPSATR